MAKLTLLKMVKNILSSMDSDEVTTITETVESQQVATIIEETYFELLDRRDWEYLKHRVRQLDAPSPANVVQLAIPSDVVHVEQVRYHNFDNSDKALIKYLSPREFVDRTINRDATQTEFESVTISDSAAVVVYNDRVPNYWTSFDEQNITFDAYDKANEASGLTVGNSFILAEVRPVFTQSDAFVPDMPERMFSLLVHEARSTCFLQLKQTANAKSEQIARRQYTKLRELERATVKDQEEVNYGR